MWFIFAIAATLLWGCADLFYKKGSQREDRYSHLKIVIAVGAAMGIHAIFFMIFTDVVFKPIMLLEYLPVSGMYILSMTLGYFGLKFLELSISSPIQNSSGAIASILCIIFFASMPDTIEIIGIVVVSAGVLLLSIFEWRAQGDHLTADKKYRNGALALAFPLLYCAVDGLGTFLDGYYLEEKQWLSEGEAIVAYELTFLICGILCLIFLLIKKQPLSLPREKDKAIAAVFETAGETFYVFAIARNAATTAPIVASYCVVSVILSRIFLKERPDILRYLAIIIVFGGIFILGLSEALNA